MEELGQMWGLYEEWQQGFAEKADQDWITFRLHWNHFQKHLVLLCVPACVSNVSCCPAGVRRTCLRSSCLPGRTD